MWHTSNLLDRMYEPLTGADSPESKRIEEGGANGDGGIVEHLRVDQVRFQEAKYELYSGAVVELWRPAIILQWWRTPVAEDVCETVVVKDVGAFL